MRCADTIFLPGIWYGQTSLRFIVILHIESIPNVAPSIIQLQEPGTPVEPVSMLTIRPCDGLPYGSQRTYCSR
jgi:hypothetical protein